jgi:hypothetical protein
LRAHAQEIYCVMAAEAAGRDSKESAPTPDPSSLRFDGQAPTPNPSPLLARARGGGEETSLTARVRALYEGVAVPVREIASLAGVSERTIYKYVAKGGWKRRYVCIARDDAAARGQRGRLWLRAPGHEMVKGAGGRFIARADAGKPFARGLKALDRTGHARALGACDEASRLGAVAQAKAEAAKRDEARIRAIDTLNVALAAYARFRQDCARRAARSRPRQPPPQRRATQPGAEPSKHLVRARARAPALSLSPLETRLEGLFIAQVELALRRLEGLLGAKRMGEV